jgi:hypothetical protein
MKNRSPTLILWMLVYVASILLCGCATDIWPQDYFASRNTGDRIATSLRLGMSMEDIRSIVSKSDYRDYAKEGPLDSVLSEKELNGFYWYPHYPKDILKDLKVGTEYKWFSYWITANTNVAIYLFFDESGRLKGWANYPSKLTLEKYLHERVTSQIRCSKFGLQKGMTRAQIHALIGNPSEMFPTLPEGRSILEDHFWFSIGEPELHNRIIELYTYGLSNGTQRRVYVIYYPGSDQPCSDWGYDQAWEEGERYIRDTGEKQK